MLLAFTAEIFNSCLKSCMNALFATLVLCWSSSGDSELSQNIELDPSKWRVVVDGVMGGLSSGNLTKSTSGLQFRGDLSLKNNGGFAWARTRQLDLQLGFDGFEIEVLGDGRKWDFMVNSLRRRMMAGGYRSRFQTTKGVRTVHRLPLAEFEAVSFGRVLARGDLRASDCSGVGVLIGDKREESFDLTLIRISTYSTSTTTSSDTKEQSPEKAILLQAVEMGVPRYNNGDHAGCADLYELSIRSVLLMGDLTKDLQEDTLRDFRSAMTLTSDQDRAWAHRRNIDRLLEQSP